MPVSLQYIALFLCLAIIILYALTFVLLITCWYYCPGRFLSLPDQETSVFILMMFHNPIESGSHEGRHKAPTLSHHPSPVLTDEERRSERFPTSREKPPL